MEVIRNLKNKNINLFIYRNPPGKYFSLVTGKQRIVKLNELSDVEVHWRTSFLPTYSQAAKYQISSNHSEEMLLRDTQPMLLVTSLSKRRIRADV